jgi:hypothetical protein
MSIDESVDIIFDLIDNIMPGIIGFFSGIVVTTKKNITEYAEYYRRNAKLVKLFYMLFIILHLAFVFFIQDKRVISSNIYIKIASAVVNLIIFLYTSIKTFK